MSSRSAGRKKEKENGVKVKFLAGVDFNYYQEIGKDEFSYISYGEFSNWLFAKAYSLVSEKKKYWF